MSRDRRHIQDLDNFKMRLIRLRGKHKRRHSRCRICDKDIWDHKCPKRRIYYYVNIMILLQ